MFKSVLISLLVISTVWLLALFQPSNVYADSDTNVDPQPESTVQANSVAISHKQVTTKLVPNVAASTINDAAQVYNETIKIVGSTLNIQLSDIHIAWLDFKDNQALHKQLKAQPKTIYALYNNFTDSFQRADVTIGYDINELSKIKHATLINMNNSLTILPLGKYTDSQLRTAWKKVNYAKPVQHILEVHHLNPANAVESAEIFVTYK